MPHYAYARSDKKDAPRISIGGRLVADLLATAGACRVLAMTLHSPQVHGFFASRSTTCTRCARLAGHFRGQDLSNTVVVSPDLGNAKEAAAFARMLGVPVAAGAKQRFSDDGVHDQRDHRRGRRARRHRARRRDRQGHDGDRAARPAARAGARSVRVACTHGLFADGALKRLAASPRSARSSAPTPCRSRRASAPTSCTVLSIAPALAEAMRRIHNGESVSALFDPH